MTLSEELKWRGFVNQTTLQNITVLDGKQLTFYWGVDPSADSMHIGQFAMTMMIRHFINHGHKAVLLTGGATGLIGDPDGKSAERELKSVDEIESNSLAITEQYKKLFADQPFEVVNNYDWFKSINYLDFLRDIGKHFSMTQLLDREFIQTRIGKGGSGISYAEFSYSLIQGYDFLHLYRTKGTTLQIAGSDQWGNSLSGVQLLRKIENVDAHVWTAPLVINKSTGKKFGKSEEGTIWIDQHKTSVFQLYQFLLNVDDASVIDYLKLFTLLTKEQIEQIVDTMQKDPGQRVAQKRLAYEVTKLIHGEARAENARNISAVLFGTTSFNDLLSEELDMLSLEIPTTTAGNVIDALVMSNVAKSNSDAGRLISDNAISINGQKISDNESLQAPSLIKKGKNVFLLVK